MSNPTSNFGWQMPTPTDLVTSLPADFEVFGQAVDSSMADLKGGTSGQILSKNSNTDMDFVWITNDQGDITAVNAGTGITGGGTSGDVTITNSMATAIDAKGDLIAGTGADAFSRLAVGTNGQMIIADSTTATGLKYVNQPRFQGVRLYKSGTQSLANNVGTLITFDTEQYDSDNYHSLVTNPQRITVPVAGWYRFYGQVSFATSGTGYRFIGLTVSNIFNLVFANGTPTGAGATTVNFSATMPLNPGDFVEMFGQQNSGGALNALAGINETVLEMQYVGV